MWLVIKSASYSVRLLKEVPLGRMVLFWSERFGSQKKILVRFPPNNEFSKPSISENSCPLSVRIRGKHMAKSSFPIFFLKTVKKFLNTFQCMLLKFECFFLFIRIPFHYYIFSYLWIKTCQRHKNKDLFEEQPGTSD